MADPDLVGVLRALAARRFRLHVASPVMLEVAAAAGVACENAFALLDDAGRARMAAERAALDARLAGHEQALWWRFAVGGASLGSRIGPRLATTLDVAAQQSLAVTVLAEALAARGELAGIVLGHDTVPVGRAAALVARRLGVKTVHVPHAILPRPNVPAPWQGSQVYADVVCAPGEFSRAQYVGHGAAPDAIVLTGAPRWDAHADRDEASRNRLRADTAAALRLDPAAPIVVFGPSWIERSTANASQHVQGALAVLQGVLAGVARSPGAQLVVKLHPGEMTRPGVKLDALAQGYLGVARRAGVGRVTITGGHRAALVATADVLVGINSNLCLEAMLCGRAVVNVPLIPEEAGLLFSPGEADGVRALGLPSETADAVADLLGDVAARARLAAAALRSVRRYVHAPDGRAAERVADVVARTTPRVGTRDL
jgi:hypothetical protein